MINQTLNSNIQPKYDLIERTALFGENILDFAKLIERSPINNPLINQIVRSGTSVGANYSEANESNSKKDFLHKISLAKKEAKETSHCLRMIIKANPSLEKQAKPLQKEAHELVLIFSSIVRKGKIV